MGEYFFSEHSTLWCFICGHLKEYVSEGSQGKVLISEPLPFLAAGGGIYIPGTALRMQTLRGVWGCGGASIHGTDFKWTNCIFILSAAVFREAAVLRCFIISHLYHSLRTQSCSKFLVPGAILKNGWLSPSSECCIHGRGLPLTCGDNASFRLPARAVNGMLWPSSL